MSFESLVKKLMKEGKSKTAATKIAGSVANAKMKGAGSGPTAKQKARAKSPAKNKVSKSGKVYKYKSEDPERKIKGKEIAPRKGKPTETKQTIKYKNAKKGEVKKTKLKGYVGGPKANKAAGLKETYKEKVKGGKNKKYTVDDDGYLKDKKGNSPATKKKPRAVVRDKDRVADKSRSYTDKKGRKIEIKTFKHEKAYDSGVKEDPNKPSMKRKSSRLSNTVELQKTKTKKDGTTKTKIKRAAGGTKKSQRLHTKFAKGKNEEGSSDVTTTRKSPATMKSPAKKPLKGGQKSLPKELQQAILKSPGKMLSKSGIKMMDKSPMNMKTPMKKQKSKSTDVHGNVTKTTVKGNKKKEVTRVKREYASNAKPLAENPTIKRKGKKRYVKKTTYASNAQPLAENPSKVKTKGTAPIKKSKQKVEQDYARNAIADYKSGKKKEAKYEKKKALELAAGESPAKMKNPSKKRAKLMDKVEKFDNLSNWRGRPGNLKPRKKDVSAKRYDKRIDRGFEKADKKMSKVMAIDSAAKMKKSPSMMKTNQDGGGYAAKNPAAPARQLKKLGSVLSKHFKSNM